MSTSHMSQPLLLIFRAVLKQSLFETLSWLSDTWLEIPGQSQALQFYRVLSKLTVGLCDQRGPIWSWRALNAAHRINADGSCVAFGQMDDTVTSSSPCLPQRCLSGTKQTQTAWIYWWHSGGCQVSCLNTVMVGRSPVVVRFILFPGQTFLSFCFETENVRSPAVVFQSRHQFSNSGKDVLS